MVTKEDENIAAAGSKTSTFRPNKKSVLFQKETSRKTTLSPTDAAIKKADECIVFLPNEMQKIVKTDVFELYSAHHQYREAEIKHNKNVNDPNYLPSSAKWKSSLQPSKRVIRTVGYERVEASLNKVVEQCKEHQKEAALALQLMDRDDKRNHTIFLAWDLLMKLTGSIIKVVLHFGDSVKPGQKLIIQVLLKTIRTNINKWNGMFGCHWGNAFLVLKERTQCENTLACDPSFVSDNITVYDLVDSVDLMDLSDMEMPDVPNPGFQKADSGAEAKTGTTDTGTMTDISTLKDPASGNLDGVRKQLSLSFQTFSTTREKSPSTSYHDPEGLHFTMNFALRNQKTDVVSATAYGYSLKAHLERFISNLVLEEDDSDRTAGTCNYTHKGILVRSNKTVRQNNTTQDGATSTTTPSQSNTGENTLALTVPTATSNAASTAATSTTTSTASPTGAVIVIEETPGAPETQKTPDADQSPSPGDPAQGESVENNGNGNDDEARPMEDPLSQISSSQLVEIMDSVFDAYDGLIHAPYCAYDETVKTLKENAALVESFIESDYVQKTEEALDLVHKEKRVTPPILNETIQQQIEPVKKDVQQVKKQTISILSQTQKRNKNKRESKKRKKLEQKMSTLGISEDDDDVEAGPTTETEQQRKRKKRKKSKNSNSHPGSAPSVTQKKIQTTGKKGKGKQGKKKKSGKQQESESTSTTPTQPQGRKSRKQSKKKNGGN